MTRRILRRALAFDDLDQIAEYIQRDSRAAAVRFLEAAERTFLMLADSPEMGTLCRDNNGVGNIFRRRNNSSDPFNVPLFPLNVADRPAKFREEYEKFKKSSYKCRAGKEIKFSPSRLGLVEFAIFRVRSTACRSVSAELRISIGPTSG